MSKHRTVTQRMLQEFLAHGYLIQGEFKADPYHSVKRPQWCKITDDAKEIRVRIYTSNIRDHGKQMYYLLSKPINERMQYRVVERSYRVLGTELTEEHIIEYFCNLQNAIKTRNERLELQRVVACWIEEVFDYANH